MKKKNNNYISRRVISYFIDILIISILVTLVAQINFLNPKKNDYNKSIEKYEEYYSSNIVNTNTIDKNIIQNDEYVSLVHDVQYYGLSYTIIETCIIIAYFTLFPFFNNDQTIGKRIMKVKYQMDNTGKVKLFNYFLKSLIMPICLSLLIYNPCGNIFNIINVLVFSGKEYIYIYELVSILINIYCYIDIIYMLSNKENLALHDRFTKIRVVEV